MSGSGIFAFTEHDIIYLLRNIYLLIPGVYKCIGVYGDIHEREISLRMLQNPSEHSVIEEYNADEKVVSALNKIRTEKRQRRWEWMQEKDLPFENSSENVYQLDVFSELNNNILQLHLPSEEEGLHDLLYIFFSGNPLAAYTGPGQKAASAETKNAVAAVIHRNLLACQQLNRHNREVLKQNNSYTRQLVEKFNQLRDESGRNREKHEEMLENYVMSRLNSLAGPGMQFRLSQAARAKIRSFEGDLDELRRSVEQAAVYAGNLNFGLNQSMITLEDFHLEFSGGHNVTVTSDTAVLMTRYVKTVSLLDKLEEAAMEVIHKNMALTGSNVGNACRKAISAPAITDALRKHRQKIISLMKMYPEKWPVIRREFKPLLNILQPLKGADSSMQRQA